MSAQKVPISILITEMRSDLSLHLRRGARLSRSSGGLLFRAAHGFYEFLCVVKLKEVAEHG